MTQGTKPANNDDQPESEQAVYLTLAPSVEEKQTGAFYVHKDYVKIRGAWEVEQHIPPISTSVSFGDVDSWAEYVGRFSIPTENTALLTWSEQGLSAILDYHDSADEPGRCAWKATMPFMRSPEWT